MPCSDCFDCVQGLTHLPQNSNLLANVKRVRNELRNILSIDMVGSIELLSIGENA
jgi:hypothetical protein